MKELTIGRHPDNDIVIDSPKVGRHHAKIVSGDDGIVQIVDLQSVNGTFVNGRKVKSPLPIRPGDRIMLANVPLPGNWNEILAGRKPAASHPEPATPTPPPQQAAPTVIPASVLYDFTTDVDAIFSSETTKLKSIIDTFKSEELPVRRHSSPRHFSEDVLDLLIERYDFIGSRIDGLLKRFEKECSTFQESYEADMKKLDVTYQFRLAGSRGEAELAAALAEVDQRKDLMHQRLTEMRKTVLPWVNAIIDEYYTKNPPFFGRRMELATAESDVWDTLPRSSVDIQKTFLLGMKTIHYRILGEPVELRQRQYCQSIYGGNLLFRYSKKTRQSCFEAVNTLLARMLAAAPGGNVRVTMVDPAEMEGTSSQMKGLDKKLFRIVSRYDDFVSLVNALASHTENIIQNLLQGDILNIAEYNLGKTEKVPFEVVVLKDVPAGFGGDLPARIAKLLRTGPKAGVSLVVLADTDAASLSQEFNNTLQQLEDAFTSAQCETYDFTSSPGGDNIAPKYHYEKFSPGIISAVVAKVNKSLEVKTETILRFGEYMLPTNEWWTGLSANRIDLAFGLTQEMKTAALQITQESGQNTAIVIGIPGSGKSVFLHTIIASAITRYSPAELQLYLLDFSGVEFNVYAKHKLPHARVIAPEAEREFGLSILREVFEEGNRRMALCRQNGVTNIVELKRSNPDIIVPRLLVVVDEFQKIFEIENDNISKEANAKIHAIIQEYRKFGINLILATQKLPAKNIVPYDLIANRVVFKSDPNDFNNLIRWPHNTPAPRLQTGMCIYNNESGAEMANSLARSYFINASGELEAILNQLTEFAAMHQEALSDEPLRVFRSDELPRFTRRIVADGHSTPSDLPREVGIYLGESIAIAPTHVFAPLTKDSNNNLLVIGGLPQIAKGITFHSMISAIAAHTEKMCYVFLFNFMTDDDPSQSLLRGKLFSSASDYCNLNSPQSPDQVKDYLLYIKDNVVDARKNNPSEPYYHFYLTFFDFQRARMFDGSGSRGDLQSECARLLEYILKNGPMVGVFTFLQVDNLANLTRLGYNAQNLFCHRVALQMSERDSEKIVGNASANKLLILNRPSSNFRALYYNEVTNSLSKLKPYSIT